MDTLAYLHLAETYEASVNSQQENIADSDLCYPEMNWGQEQRGALMLLISFALGVSSLGWTNTAQALKKGEKSPQVVSLQQKLQAAGYFKQAVTGYYGPITEAAVIKFQKAYGLKADGIVGSETLAALGLSSTTVTSPPTKTKSTVTTAKKSAGVSSQAILQRGDLSYEVMSLQRKLQAAGYFDLPITGDFNAATEEAVIKFQQAHGLVGNGMVDTRTLGLLESSSRKAAKPPSQTNPSAVETPQKTRQPQISLLRRGNINSQVKSIQQQLQAAGYFDLPITGDFNAATEEAVIKFQQAHGLVGNGIVDTRTLAALESRSRKAAKPPSQPTNPSAVETPQKTRQLQISLLRRGDTSSQVKSIQQQLQASGYFEQSITGSFDAATEVAVIKFQKAHGLMTDGIVGPKTLAVLKSQSQKPGVINQSPQIKSLNKQKTIPTKPKVNSPKVASDVGDRQDLATINQAPDLDNFSTEATPPASDNNATELVSSPTQNLDPKQSHLKKNYPSHPPKMTLKKVISGRISPKSVVHSGNGLFFAQNMMYNHTITVYDRQHKLVKVIPDKVDLSKYGYSQFKGNYRGAPVEASFSQDGKYAWISNYQMYGPGFNNPGSDKCNPSQKTDKSFLYRINTDTLEIDHVVQVGSVPKFVATTNDERLVLVSNWCSWDLSVVDTAQNREIKRIKLGPYPRGIAIDAAANKAYIAVMGSYNIAQVDLNNFSVKWLKNIGRSPRHLNIDPTGEYLYASLNGEGKIAKINLPKSKLVGKVSTGNAPRSMVLSDDGERLYVVNYSDHTVSKVRTSDMKVMQKMNVGANPIGITYDPETREVWVACYSGNIMVFQD